MSVHGSVPDVTPYLDDAAVVVAPLRIGGSMRGKVLEALAAGKALVATPRAAEGVHEEGDDHLLVAETEDELVDAIVRVLLDRDLRRALGGLARAWATRNLGLERAVQEYEDLYDSLIGTN